MSQNKLKHADLDLNCLSIIFHAIIVSRVTYALPAWYGQLSQSDAGQDEITQCFVELAGGN